MKRNLSLNTCLYSMFCIFIFSMTLAVIWFQRQPNSRNWLIVERNISFNFEKKNEEQFRRNIVFVKTHKTAGSTIQNILIRYGLRHNLTIAFPLNKHNFNYPKPFRKDYVHPDGFSKGYNIICHHMKFKYTSVQEVMPRDSVYITIIREPAALFQSTFAYMRLIVPSFKLVPLQINASEIWLDNADKHLLSAKTSPFTFFTRNHLMSDLGYNYAMTGDTYIKKAISEIDSIFDLILITDHIEESLVLLSQLLRVPLEEVAFLKVLEREKTNQTKELRRRIRDKVRKRNTADTALFDYFNASLWKKIEKFGFDKMANQVIKLRQINKNLYDLCVGNTTGSSYPYTKNKFWTADMYQPKGQVMKRYRLKEEAESIKECTYLVAPPKSLSLHAFSKQKELIARNMK